LNVFWNKLRIWEYLIYWNLKRRSTRKYCI